MMRVVATQFEFKNNKRIFKNFLIKIKYEASFDSLAAAIKLGLDPVTSSSAQHPNILVVLAHNTRLINTPLAMVFHVPLGLAQMGPSVAQPVLNVRNERCARSAIQGAWSTSLDYVQTTNAIEPALHRVVST